MASRRSIQLPESLRALVTTHLAEHVGPQPHAYFFPAPGGGPLRSSNFRQRQFDPAKRAANLPDKLTFHGLRHTAASLAIAAGADPKTIQHMMGHTTIRMTLDTYGHRFKNTSSVVAAALNRIVDGLI